MVKWQCVCGEQIRTSGEIPNPIESLVLSATKWDALDSPIPSGTLYSESSLMYRCPTSDHLWVFWEDPGKAPSLYAPIESPLKWDD